MEKHRNTILKLENERMEQENIHLKKELYTIKMKRMKNSIIGTQCDKFGNKISMLETSIFLMGRKLPRRAIFHCQGILLLHYHQV